MSNTFRRKNASADDLRWILREYVGYGVERRIHPHSKEGKRLLARYHSDAGGSHWREPGPSWFRNITVQRPQRREGARQLKKYMLDPEMEVILEPKPPLPYWS